MPATIFSGSKVKALKDRFSLNDVTEIISVSADPTSGGGISAPLGSIAMDYLAGKVYKKTGSLATEWQELGAGLGGINYIENPDAESGTAGWSTYADAAGTAPVDGTGGSPNITWSRSTTTPLRGVADFALVKDGVNRQGEGVSYNFTIDSADKAKVLTVSFDYEVLSGSYATGDLAVYIIQDPAGTPVVIQPAGYQVQAATVGTTVKHIATFQTASNVTSYRLCVHVASVSTATYSLALDNISVGPQVVQYGAPITDPVSATPTWTNLGFSGTSVNSIVWWRAGKFLFARAYFNPSAGTGSASGFLLTLPAGLSIDNSAVPGPESPASLGVYKVYDDAGGAATGIGTVDYDTATRVAFRRSDSATFTTSAMTTADTFSCEFSVPIAGWSSTVQMSNDTDTRVVAASYVGTSIAISAAATFKPTTKSFDTHSAFNTSTGVYTVPVPGIYRVSTTGYTNVTAAATRVDPYIYKNGAPVTGLTAVFNSGANSVRVPMTFSGLVSCIAGETLSVVTATVVGVSSIDEGGLNIERLSGPSAIAASETVAARYATSAAPAISAAGATITYGIRIFDSHGAMSGANYAVPVGGLYRVSFQMHTASVAWAANGYVYGEVLKGGSADATLGLFRVAAAVTASIANSGTAVLRCNAGELLSIKVYSSAATTLGANTLDNYVCIERIGN
jgi:hypothetical protein